MEVGWLEYFVGVGCWEKDATVTVFVKCRQDLGLCAVYVSVPPYEPKTQKVLAEKTTKRWQFVVVARGWLIG